MDEILRYVKERGENTHGAVRGIIYKEWLSDEGFRKASRDLRVRPLDSPGEE
jgi:hypothetical protein